MLVWNVASGPSRVISNMRQRFSGCDQHRATAANAPLREALPDNRDNADGDNARVDQHASEHAPIPVRRRCRIVPRESVNLQPKIREAGFIAVDVAWTTELRE